MALSRADIQSREGKSLRLKKWGMAGLAVVTSGAVAFGVLSTVGIASAQTPPGGGQGQRQGPNRQRGLEMLAQQLGVTVQQLQQATPQQRSGFVDQALAAGKITQAQADRLKRGFNLLGQFGQHSQSNGQNNHSKNQQHRRPQGQGGQRGQGGFQGLGSLGFTDPIATLAGSMGLTKDDLNAQLRAGKRLADIGADHGRTPESLRDTLVTQLQGDLKTQVSSGTLTQRQADTIARGAGRLFLAMINHKGGQFTPGQFGQRFGQQDGVRPQGGPGGPSGAPQGAPQQGQHY